MVRRTAPGSSCKHQTDQRKKHLNLEESNLSNRFWQKPRRVTAGLVAGAVVSLAAFAASPAGATISTTYPQNGDGDRLVRIFGQDRYETSISVASVSGTPFGPPMTSFDGANASTCGIPGPWVFASGENYPDALAAGALAQAVQGPLGFGKVILVPSSAALPALTANFIKICATTVSTAYVVGGTAAITTTQFNAINNQLQAGANNGRHLERIAGATRYGTAAAIAAKVRQLAAQAAGSSPNSIGTAPDIAKLLAGTTASTAATLRTVIITSGEVAADAVSASPLSAAGYVNPLATLVNPGAPAVAGTFVSTGSVAWMHPILLTPSTALASETASAMLLVDAQQAIIVGGPAAVSDAVAAQIAALNVKVVRIGGIDRYATAALLNGTLATIGQGFTKAGAQAPVGLNTAWQFGNQFNGGVGIATLADFPDVLTAGPQLGRSRSPFFGVTPTSVPPITATTLNSLACPVAGNSCAATPNGTQSMGVYGGPNAVNEATAINSLTAIDSTQLTILGPKALTAKTTATPTSAASVALTSVAGAVTGTATVTAKLTGIAAGVTGNTWQFRIDGINGATLAVNVNTVTRVITLTVNPQAPAAAAAVAAAFTAAGTAFTDNFTVAATGTFTNSVPPAFLAGGTSTLTATVTFDQTLTAVNPALFSYKFDTPTIGVPGTSETHTGAVATVTFLLSGANSTPVIGLSYVLVAPNAVTSGAGGNTTLQAVAITA
jgi:hypothetical protein